MSDLATKEKLRAIPLQRETFEVFSIASSSLNNGLAQLIGDAESQKEAVQQGLIFSQHKAKFCVKRTDTLTGDIMLHFYTVRQRSQGTKRYHNYQTRTVRDLYAEHLFDLKPEGLV